MVDVTDDWEPKEIAAYEQRQSPVLSALYASIHDARRLDLTKPEARAEFLANYIDLTATDQDVLMGIAATRGRHYALNVLEDMAIAELSRSKLSKHLK